jgi:hypothetical protein
MTDDTYIFSGSSSKPTAKEPLPDGNYDFEILDYTPVYRNVNGRFVLKVELRIEGRRIFDQVWSGKTSSGESRDGIGDLLRAVNCAPAPGEEPDWPKLIGALGRCRLKVAVAEAGASAGKSVNRVAWYLAPKQIDPAAAASVKKEEELDETEEDGDSIPF